MKKEELKRIYRQQILERNKNPYHFEKRKWATGHCLANNPICGDKFTLYLDFNHDNIRSAHFYGFGCALSKASTSILMEKIEGMPQKDVIAFCKMFLAAVRENQPIDPKDLSLETLAQMRDYQGRLDCITLSWETLLNHLLKKEMHTL